MKLSLSSFIYYHYSLIQAIPRIAKAGYDGVDIWGGRPHAYRKDLGENEIISIRRELSNSGLSVASFIVAMFRYPANLCSPNNTIRHDSVAYVCDEIETATELGAPIISICPGHTLQGQSRKDGYKRLRESLCTIAETAANYPIKVAIEPADRYETDLLLTCSRSYEFINDLGFDNLGILLDNGHAFVVGEDIAAAIELMGDRLFHIHVDDNIGLRDQHMIPGEGNFDFPPFFTAIDSSNYSGFLGIELGWDYTIDPDAAAQLSCQRVRSYLNNNESTGKKDSL